MDQLDSDFDRPFYEAEMPDVDSYIEENSLKYVLLSTAFPAYQQVRNAMDRLTGRKEGVIAALAIHRHMLANGEWPGGYEDLVPEFLSQAPIDEVTGGPLRFKYDDNGQLLIYSVGNDRDDDGGADRTGPNGGPEKRQAFIFQKNANASNVADGDWIVWPQQPANE